MNDHRPNHDMKNHYSDHVHNRIIMIIIMILSQRKIIRATLMISGKYDCYHTIRNNNQNQNHHPKTDNDHTSNRF